MFSKVSLAALALTMSTSVFARDQDLINLKSSKASQTIRIDYPGNISDSCGLEIKTSSDLWLSPEQKTAIAAKLVVRDGFQDSYAQTVDADLSEWGPSWTLISQGTYVTHVKVSTVGGESLAKAVRSVIGNKDGAVLLSTTACPLDNPN